MLSLRILVSLFLLTIVFFATGQTNGIGELSSIEAKSNQIDQNRLRNEQYKIQLISLDSSFKVRLKKMQTELGDLIKERDALIEDMKKGAKCSQCGKYKSEFEKEGVDFIKHLGEVKGYAVPATTSELEATRQKFSERIAIKRVLIQNYEKNDNGKIAKQQQINDLEAANQKYCKEITDHSRSYDTKVFSEAKAKHIKLAEELLNYVSDILIAEDKILIFKARIIRYDKDFRGAADSIRNAVKQKIEAEQLQKNDKIKLNENDIYSLRVKQEEYTDSSEDKLGRLKREKINIDQQLRAINLKDSIKLVLISRQTVLIREIKGLEKDILTYKTNTNNKISAFEKENAQLKKEIFDLTVNLSKLQEKEIAKIKPEYDRKKTEAAVSISKSTSDAATARTVYDTKKNEYNIKQKEFFNLIEKEMYRMMTASQKVSCGIFNEIRGKVSGDWNQVTGCVQNIVSSAKSKGTTSIFNSYCGNTFSDGSLLSGYKSFLKGLSPEDEAAVKAGSNLDWFESLKY